MSKRPENWEVIRHFSRKEFVCRCGCGLNNIDFELVQKLDLARTISGVPFVITSGCRCANHNLDSGGMNSSAHLTGNAVDISALDAVSRFMIISSLLRVGFVRLGIGKDYVHVDNDRYKPQNVAWFY